MHILPSDGLDTSVFDVKYGAEDFELLFMFPSQWSRVFGPSFSKIAIMPQIPKKQLELNPEMALPIE